MFRNGQAIDSVEPKHRNVSDTGDVIGASPAVTGLSAGDLLEQAEAVRRAGQPFVLATVVRSLRPASAKPGDRALLFADRRTVGWVGGGCVHTSIEREAARALADGAPR